MINTHLIRTFIPKVPAVLAETLIIASILNSAPSSAEQPSEENTRSIEVKVKEYCTDARTAKIEISAVETMDRSYPVKMEVLSISYFDLPTNYSGDVLVKDIPAVLEIDSMNTNRPEGEVEIKLSNDNGLEELLVFDRDRWMCNKREPTSFNKVDIEVQEVCTENRTAAIWVTAKHKAHTNRPAFLSILPNRKYPGLEPTIVPKLAWPDTLDTVLDSESTNRPSGIISTYLNNATADGSFEEGGLVKTSFKRDRLLCNKVPAEELIPLDASLE